MTCAATTAGTDAPAPARMIASEIYRRPGFAPAHPLRIPRVSTVLDLSRALGWLPRERYLSSPRARPETLLAWHSADYVAALVAAEAEGQVSEAVRARHGLGTVSNPVYPLMFRRPATSVGGAILAGQLLRQPGAIHLPAGGTHHGMPDRAAGFCYLNDPVFAILSLRASGLTRIAYVDIDAHHPDGVEAGFGGDPDILMVSVHEERRWPFTGALDDRGAGNVWNLPLPVGAGDAAMRAALDEVILPRVAAHRPQAIVLQCGADAVEEDPLSRLALSNGAHLAVLRALRPHAPRFLLLGGGGYNPWSVARLWTAAWGVLSGRELPDRLPAPAEAVLRGLAWPGRAAGRVPPEPWFTTLCDPPREGQVGEEVRGRLRHLSRRAAAWV